MYRGKFESNNRAPRPAAPRPDTQAQTPATPQAPRQNAAPAPRAVSAPAPKKSKKPTVGTVVFYSMYALLVIVLCISIHFALNWLNGWLTDFEASQPDAKCQQVFNQYFADPDWSQVYDLLDPEAVGAMTEDSFTDYMQQKVGDTALTYTKTSAGLSGGRKYILRLDGENIGTFTLMNSVTGDLEIPDWQLDNVEIFVSAREYVTVQTQYGNTVTVNGQTLTENHVIRTTATVAEDYLPEGVYGPRSVTYYIGGLLTAPEVAVTDADGNAVAMDYDAETKTYTQNEDASAEAITDKEHKFVLEGTQAYFRFMLHAATEAQLKQYFDPSSDTYATIVKSEDPWLQNFRTYAYGEDTISNFRRYGDDLFSLRIAMDLNVTRTNGTIKTFSLDTTFFVKKDGSSFKIISMTNVDVDEVLTQVRMTFMQSGKQLSSEMVSANVTSLTPPAVEVPEGKVFSGWFKETVSENGDTTYTLVFQNGEDGKIAPPTGYTLEPMTLHALFEEAE